MKDLELDWLTVEDRADKVTVEVAFAPNRFKHDNGLIIRYTNVTGFDLGVTAAARTKHIWPESRRLGAFQLDEILPHEGGCSHEIKFVGGRVWIVAEDLTASWTGPPAAA